MKKLRFTKSVDLRGFVLVDRRLQKKDVNGNVIVADMDDDDRHLRDVLAGNALVKRVPFNIPNPL